MRRYAAVVGILALSPLFWAAQSRAAAPARYVFRPAAAPPLLKSPQGIAVDAHGNVLVADSGNDRIVELSPVGKVLARWGSAGSRAGQYNLPLGVAASSAGTIYVADSKNNRIQELSGSGRPLRQWPIKTPVDVTVGSKGTVFVSDGGGVAVFDANGKASGRWSFPSPDDSGDHIAVDGSGRVYVRIVVTPSNTGGKGSIVGSTVWGFLPSGKLIDRYPPFDTDMNSFTVDRSGNSYVDYASALKKYSPSGKLLLQGSVAGYDAWTVAPDGTLYGLKSDGGTIVKLSTRLKLLARWSPRARANRSLAAPAVSFSVSSLAFARGSFPSFR